MEHEWRRIEERLVGLQWDIQGSKKENENLHEELRKKMSHITEDWKRSESIGGLDRHFNFLVISLTLLSSAFLSYLLSERSTDVGRLDPGIFRFTALSVLVPVISWVIAYFIGNRKSVVFLKSLAWTFGVLILGRYILLALDLAGVSIPYTELLFYVVSLGLLIPGALISYRRISRLHEVPTRLRLPLAIAAILLSALVFHWIRPPQFLDKTIVTIGEAFILMVLIVLLGFVFTRNHDEGRSNL